MVLEISQISQENTCARVSFIKKETLPQVFFCEFFEISSFKRPPFLLNTSGRLLLNLTTYHFSSKNIKVFHWLLKSKPLSIMTALNKVMETKQNQTFFHESYSNLISFFIGHKILKCFNNFYNWHLSILVQKSAQTSKRGTLFKWLFKFISW